MTRKLQSVAVPNVVPKEGEGIPRSHVLFADRPVLEYLDEHIRTLHENFENGVLIAGNSPFLGHRAMNNGVAGAYVWETYKDVALRRDQVSSALISRGFNVQDNIGLYSINRAEWIIAEYSCFRANLVTVPLYDTLGDEAIQHICNQAELKLVIATKDKAQNLLRLKPKLQYLTIIVVMDGADETLKTAGSAVSVEVISFKDFEAEGAGSIKEARPPRPDDAMTICYTSGTTGLPKGAVLTHANMVAEAASIAFLGREGQAPNFGPHDCHISYLPLAHVFERTVVSMFIGKGARIGFYQGDTLKLMDDIAELKPTFFVSVPRLFNRIYDKVNAGIASKGGLAALLFKIAYNAKREGLKQGHLTHWLWDRLVFNKVKARLGGRVNCMLTGSAPLSPDVMEFLRICFGCEVHEGYGQTETTAGATLTNQGDYEVGHIGVPMPCLQVKLVDVPEMSYTSKDQPFPRGEICFKGANCFREYYKDPEKTKEAIDDDGWVHSGDIGSWDDKGRLKIIDRKKNIFKLAQGEYIAPEKIENVLSKSTYIAQAYIHGDSLRASLVAVIVPDEEVLKPWATSQNIEFTDFAALCKLPAVKEFLLAELPKHCKANNLKGFEIPRGIYVESQLFTIENDLLTPSFKLKRHEAKKKYAQVIESVYAEIKE